MVADHRRGRVFFSEPSPTTELRRFFLNFQFIFILHRHSGKFQRIVVHCVNRDGRDNPYG